MFVSCNRGHCFTNSFGICRVCSQPLVFCVTAPEPTQIQTNVKPQGAVPVTLQYYCYSVWGSSREQGSLSVQCVRWLVLLALSTHCIRCEVCHTRVGELNSRRCRLTFLFNQWKGVNINLQCIKTVTKKSSGKCWHTRAPAALQLSPRGLVRTPISTVDQQACMDYEHVVYHPVPCALPVAYYTCCPTVALCPKRL